MAFSYNITFVTQPQNKQELVSFITKSFLFKVINPESPARNPSLKKVIEAGGEKPGPDHGVSLAFSVDFENEEVAREWNDSYLIPALGDFHSFFGVNSLFFVTLLENLDI